MAVTLRQRVYEILERAHDEDRLSTAVDVTIVSLIAVNALAIIVESLPWVGATLMRVLDVLETASVVVFTVEYFLRVWSARYRHPSQKGVAGALRFIVSPAGIIDLLAILPFYLPLGGVIDLRFMRLLRLFKLGRYMRSMSLFGRVLRERRSELLITVMMTSLMLLIASILMYYIEGSEQPDKFPNILSSLWWAVVTLTTIGYGDVVPVTGLGRLLSGLVALMGIGLVAVPPGIVSSGFIEALAKKRSKPEEDRASTARFCPCCGQPLEAQKKEVG